MTLDERIRSWYETVVEKYRWRTNGSAELYEQGRRYLPGADTRYSVTHRPYPLYFHRGEGPSVWDVDGNELLDFNNQASALIHGHAHPEVIEAIQTQAAKGTAWGAHNEHEIPWAQLLCGRIPSVERIRFTNSGTEANMLMVKVARAVTGKDAVLKFNGGYHGTFDGLEFVAAPDQSSPGPVPSTGGVPANLNANVVIATWGDADEVKNLVSEHAHRLAAVIMTPVWSEGRFAAPPPGFLQTVREITSAHDVLLLFDEVIAFRMAMGGAQERYGVVPDMTALGKLIGGGLPVGAFGGRQDVMSVTNPLGDLRVGLAGTFNGNPLTAVAGLATLRLLNPDSYEHLDRLSDDFRSGLAALVESAGLPLFVDGAGSLASVGLDTNGVGSAWAAASNLVIDGLRLAFVNDGVWGFPEFALSTVMDDSHVQQALQSAEVALKALDTAISKTF